MPMKDVRIGCRNLFISTDMLNIARSKYLAMLLADLPVAMVTSILSVHSKSYV